MTLVITYLAQDTARNRRRARREAQREQAMQEAALGRLITRTLAECPERVARAMSLDGLRDSQSTLTLPARPCRRHRRTGERGVTCRGKEKKQRGEKPLIG